MEQGDKTRTLLVKHCHTYPKLQTQDVFKYLYQSAFGCEHMISSLRAVTEYIREEFEQGCQNEGLLVEPLDGEYSRVYLTCLNQGLQAETLGKLFFASAKKKTGGMSDLEDKLEIARELAVGNLLPFPIDEFEEAAVKWKAGGYPAVHHSPVFREFYRPAYRVIANQYVPYLPLFARLDELLKMGPAVLAIEGGSASGKTSLSQILEGLYDCTVFHMDDFFLRPDQRTAERYAEPGGNIDRERFHEEVLVPLSQNKPVNYRRFDCSKGEIGPSVILTPKKLTVVEGVYSLHPKFGKYYDLAVFLEISPELQKKRIVKRNSPEEAKRFYDQWIPMEGDYFSKLKIKERCDLVIENVLHEEL